MKRQSLVNQIPFLSDVTQFYLIFPSILIAEATRVVLVFRHLTQSRYSIESIVYLYVLALNVTHTRPLVTFAHCTL